MEVRRRRKEGKQRQGLVRNLFEFKWNQTTPGFRAGGLPGGCACVVLLLELRMTEGGVPP